MTFILILGWAVYFEKASSMIQNHTSKGAGFILSNPENLPFCLKFPDISLFILSSQKDKDSIVLLYIS